MKISNNIPIIEHKDVINTFTKNLKKKRKVRISMTGILTSKIKNISSAQRRWFAKIRSLILDRKVIHSCKLNS